MAEKAPKKLHSFRIALAVLLMLAALFALLFFALAAAALAVLGKIRRAKR